MARRGKEQQDNAGLTSLFSGRLMNSVATRVACLTLFLGMAIPLINMWRFPTADLSPQVWARRLSQTLATGRVEDLVDDLRMMNEFFKPLDYGPYIVCQLDPGTKQCNGSAAYLRTLWSPSWQGPPRQASALLVLTDTTMVGFNMFETDQFRSGMSIATVAFIVLIMMFSGLALSGVITVLAVQPLERLQATCKQIAKTVFNFSAEVLKSEDEEIADIEQSSEMKLLQKVVQKLAAIADLQMTRQVPKDTANMQHEDIGILSMMHGTNIAEQATSSSAAVSRKSMAVGHNPMRKRGGVVQTSLRLEDFGVPPEVFNSWSFNALSLSRTQRVSLVMYTISQFHEPGEGFIHAPDEVQILQRFVTGVEREYQPVPFHSFAHAVDVLHGVSRILRLTSSDSFLSNVEQFSLLVAAVAHDLGHPGVNNGFLVEAGHELALQYNDRSPLENMHCARLYTLLSNPLTNVFGKFTKEQYRESRRCCIESILHTDMILHGAMVKELQKTFQMNAEVFLSEPDVITPGMKPAEMEIFSQPETKMLVMQCILHSADVSNPCRSWEVTHAWAQVCLEEFFAQGDQEKALGLPVQFLNDRHKLNRPHSQIGFIEFMIAPFIAAQVRLWPCLRELALNLSSNLSHWEDMWLTEVSPQEDERQKVRARVDKVKDHLAESLSRGDSKIPVASRTSSS